MAVNVIIQKKSFFSKKLTISDVIKLSGLSFGLSDENYRLKEGEVGTHTLLFDSKKLARGIDVSFYTNGNILLSLNLPSTKEEIRTFYDLIEKICTKMKTREFVRDEEVVDLSQKEGLIELDEKASLRALRDNKKDIESGVYEQFVIFGVYNPISMGKKEYENIDDLDDFSKFLDKLQKMDVFYTAPKVYSIKDKLTGIYFVAPEVDCVVPTEPYIILDQIKNIEEWYIVTGENCTIKYEDFLNNVSKKKYYDDNHVIVNLHGRELSKLVKNYKVEL